MASRGFGHLSLGTDKIALFQFPFTQWTQAAPWWRLNWMMTTWVAAGAAIPTAFLLLCAFGMIRHWISQTKRGPLYGKTDWADRPQMASGSISSSRKPF